MTTALDVELIEVAEGRWLAVDRCTANDLACVDCRRPAGCTASWRQS